jgi:hypothetical protein
MARAPSHHRVAVAALSWEWGLSRRGVMDRWQAVVRQCCGGVASIVGGRRAVPTGWSWAVLEGQAAIVVQIKVGGEGTCGAQ